METCSKRPLNAYRLAGRTGQTSRYQSTTLRAISAKQREAGLTYDCIHESTCTATKQKRGICGKVKSKQVALVSFQSGAIHEAT